MAFAPAQIQTGYPARTRTDYRAMSIATALFFMWGFLTCMNDILIPHLKAIFELSYAQAMLVQTAFFSSYFVFALPSGKVVEWRGYKQAMAIGLSVMALGALLFLPASAMASFGVFLTALVVLAAGITLLQVAANPYVTALGPQETASSRLNLAQAFNSLGTTLAPFFGSALILAGAPAALSSDKMHSLSAAALQQYRMMQAGSVRLPYLGLGLALILLAIVFAMIKMPPVLNSTSDYRPSDFHKQDSVWHHPWLVAAAVMIFLYVGAEVTIGSLIVNYLHLPEIGNMSIATAANYIPYYWGGQLSGRLVGSWLMQRLNAAVLLGTVGTGAVVLLAISIVSHGPLAMWTILGVGLCNSIIFPTVFSLGLVNLGELTSRGSSLIVMAIVGGAIIPLIAGSLADHIGLQHSFLLPLACYLAIGVYGFAASRRVIKAEPELPHEA